MPVHTALYPPADYIQIDFTGVGTTPAHSDATHGSTSASLNPWIEFSQTLSLQAAGAAPANDAICDAIEVGVGDLPYWSDVIDASTSTDTEYNVWWKWTVPATGKYCVHTLGSNCNLQIQLRYEWPPSSCAGSTNGLTISDTMETCRK
jgi:hypothetical protein